MNLRQLDAARNEPLSIEVHGNALVLTNRRWFTDLSDLRLWWEVRVDGVVVDGRIAAQARELPHRGLRAFGLLDVGRHAARDLHRHQRVGVLVRLDRDLSRLHLPCR